MSATILAAVASFFQIVFCKNQEAIFVKVVIFGFTFKSRMLLRTFAHVFRLK